MEKSGIGFQSLIGRFVTLNGVHNYYVANFITFAGITQCFVLRTHKASSILKNEKITYCDNLIKNRVFLAPKNALVRPQKNSNHKA